MTIELSPEHENRLKSKAERLGWTPEQVAKALLQQALFVEDLPGKSLKTGRGMLAKYGPAPTAEEIDENRRDMLKNSIFANDPE